jgi:hypothetical protein
LRPAGGYKSCKPSKPTHRGVQQQQSLASISLLASLSPHVSLRGIVGQSGKREDITGAG